MILVTVGTCAFNTLVRTVDRLRAAGRLDGRVVCQIGDGTYVPQHCEYFRHKPTLQPWYEEAELVICHGGTGTVCELLTLGKPFVSVANEALSGNHQADFLTVCEKEFGVCWCRRLEDLPEAIERAKRERPRFLARRHLAEDLREYLGTIRPKRRNQIAW